MHRHLPRISAALVLVAALVWAAGFVPALAQRGFSGQPGVTLYSDADFRGTGELFVGDIADLRRSRIGSDRASSVKVDRGCRAILYADVDFRGASMEVTYDRPSFSGTALGNDSASSMRVDCERIQEPPPAQPDPNFGGPDYSGVTLFWRDEFQGRSQFFHEDVPNLGMTDFGHDQASSILVDPGCRATLYEHINYTGESAVVTKTILHLKNTPVGDNKVSSLRVRCR
jgi:Beta/Gamma crystallin